MAFLSRLMETGLKNRHDNLMDNFTGVKERVGSSQKTHIAVSLLKLRFFLTTISSEMANS